MSSLFRSTKHFLYFNKILFKPYFCYIRNISDAPYEIVNIWANGIKPQNIKEENYISKLQMRLMKKLKMHELPSKSITSPGEEKFHTITTFQDYCGRNPKDARQEAYFYNDVMECLKVLKDKHIYEQGSNQN